MGQFLGADVGQDSLHLTAGRCIALVEVTLGCAELAVGSAKFVLEIINDFHVVTGFIKYNLLDDLSHSKVFFFH